MNELYTDAKMPSRNGYPLSGQSGEGDRSRLCRSECV